MYIHPFNSLLKLFRYFVEANYIQNACVKCILDSMLSSLWKNTKWKFIYSEIAFFWKWWNQIPRKKKDMVKTLVRDGKFFWHNIYFLTEKDIRRFRSSLKSGSLFLVLHSLAEDLSKPMKDVLCMSLVLTKRNFEIF